MKKQLSSLDLHFLVSELKILKDSRIDKMYQPDKNLIVFSLYKTNAGKKLLTINIGQSIFVSDEKEDYGEILGFGMLLRKHLDGYFLDDIVQVEPERIVRLSFKMRESLKHLYIEFFGKGNAILCDEHNVIINALEHHEFRERVVQPRLKYVYPVMGYNMFDINKNQLEELFGNSKKDTLVISLATELGLGGLYAEEICLLSDIDKNKSPKEIDEKQIISISNSIKKIINKKIDARVILETTDVADFAPFKLEFHKSGNIRKFDNFNSAVQYFYSQFREPKETEFDKKLKELQRVIESQKLAVEELRKEEKESREKAELIYHKYNLIKEILDELNKASEKYSWKEIKERLKNHKMIKEVNEKERKVIIEI